MKYKMSIDNYSYQFENDNSGTSEVYERNDILSDNNGFNIDLTNIFLEGIHLKWGTYQTERVKTYSVSPEKETIVAHFCLRGSCVSEHKSYLNINRGECILFKEDKDDYLFHMDVDQGVGEFFEMSLTPDLYVLNYSDTKVTDAVFKGDRLFTSISRDPLLRRIIVETYQRKENYSGKLKRIYLESKISELLLAQMHLLQENSYNRIRLHKNDIEAIHHAKDIIGKDLKHCTIASLALLVGINQTKLKIGFKELFGKTIFEYLIHLRMEKAHGLLLSTQLTIAEIALLVGYNYSQHFITAFKRYFGYTPNEMRRL